MASDYIDLSMSDEVFGKAPRRRETEAASRQPQSFSLYLTDSGDVQRIFGGCICLECERHFEFKTCGAEDAAFLLGEG